MNPLSHTAKTTKRQNSSPKGFALIAALTIMILLVMIVVGMLTLSRSETRTSTQARYQLEAQANARMALQIALAEIQKLAGSDLVSTAPPSLALTKGSKIPEAKRQILGVFSTEQFAQNNSPLVWNSRVKDTFKGWLISGKDSENLDSITQEAKGDTATLSSFKSDKDKRIQAPVESIFANGKLSGGFAWVAAGLDMTASVNLNKKGDKQYEHIAPTSFEIPTVAKDRGIDMEFSDSDLEKLVSFKTAEIFSSGASLDGETDWLNNAHYSVLSNPLEGGLKKDLTVALSPNTAAGDRNTALGLQMFPPITSSTPSYADPGGPYWEQAASYFSASGTTDLPVRPQTSTQSGFYPVIASFVEMYGMSNTRGYGPGTYSNTNKHILTMHMAPVVKLWNPYNRPLESSDYTITVGNNSQKHNGLGTDDTICTWRDETITPTAPNGQTINRYLPPSMRYEHSYHIPSVSFAPGEVKIFSLGSNSFVGGSRGTNTTNVVDPIASGYVLATLTEGVPQGYSVWDMNFTKNTIPSTPLSFPMTFSNGRNLNDSTPSNLPAPQPDQITSVSWGSSNDSTFVFDTVNPNYDFTASPGDMLNWSLKLYKGNVSKITTSAPNPPRPLVSITNINTNAKTAAGAFEIKDKEDIKALANPNTEPFFDTLGTNDASIWVRKITLRSPHNQGDDDPFLYNAAKHNTKKSRYLADFNPRASTVGIWPRENTKATASNIYLGEPLKLDGSPIDPTQQSIGTPGGYISGIITNLSTFGIALSDITPQSYIGYSDEFGPQKSILFEVPQTNTPEQHFYSVGQLRHANLSSENGDFALQTLNGFGLEEYFSDNNRPTYAIGESYADVRLGINDYDQGKFRQMTIEDGTLTGSSTHYDTSWFMNHHLWDSFFFSARKDNTQSYNPRISLKAGSQLGTNVEAINLNAEKVYMAGTFNINSTNVDAWKAFLMSTLGAPVNGASDSAAVPFSRFFQPLDGKADSTSHIDDDEVYAGYRTINTDEAKALAVNIVKEIEQRGPFYSVGDFINRSTMKGSPSNLRVKGALQAAIDDSGINNTPFDDTTIPEGSASSIYEPTIYRGHSAVGVPGYLTQGDICARLGHLMTSRTDSFLVRTYGRAVDSKGKIQAEAWCEAEIQRTPEYVDSTQPADTKFAALNATNKKFGRKFIITSFRWINPDEIKGSRS